jgi:hypothetical protein
VCVFECVCVCVCVCIHIYAYVYMFVYIRRNILGRILPALELRAVFKFCASRLPGKISEKSHYDDLIC